MPDLRRAELALGRHGPRGHGPGGLVALLADGSILLRQSGVSALPPRVAVPLEAPTSLALTLEAPKAGPLKFMIRDARVRALVAEAGLDALTAQGHGDRALARRFEIAGAIDRLRTLHVR